MSALATVRTKDAESVTRILWARCVNGSFNIRTRQGGCVSTMKFGHMVLEYYKSVPLRCNPMRDAALLERY
eukprot:6548423-Prymnesium_polylepis.1